MIDTIYIEDGVVGHSRSEKIIARFPNASVIGCKHYKEIFNPSAQSFRLQKKKPALILARQTGTLIHPIPPSYGVGGGQNYYFSHLLNCLYDCRYCFLQGMYPSAHYLLFVNYEDFQEEILKTCKLSDEPSWFFSGYDCDSLALESVTGFAEHFLPFFRELPNAWVELRTKSVAIKVMENCTPFANAVIAFSFTPHEVSKQLEHGVPSVEARIMAMSKLAKKGWKVGLRIDPLIECKDFEHRYEQLFRNIFEKVPQNAIHSVSLGAFRMPQGFYKKMEKHYPEEPLFAGSFSKQKGSMAYPEKTEERLKGICQKLLLQWIDPVKLFTCETS